MDTFVLGITLFTMIVLSLVTVIVFARSKLVSTGDVNITINGEKNCNSSSWRKTFTNTRC